jgi:hypothetical protein
MKIEKVVNVPGIAVGCSLPFRGISGLSFFEELVACFS